MGKTVGAAQQVPPHSQAAAGAALMDLPDEVLRIVIQHLGSHARIQAGKACKRLTRLVLQDAGNLALAIDYAPSRDNKKNKASSISWDFNEEIHSAVRDHRGKLRLRLYRNNRASTSSCVRLLTSLGQCPAVEHLELYELQDCNLTGGMDVNMAAAAAACFPNVKQLTVHGCSFSGPTLCHVLNSLPGVQSATYHSRPSSKRSCLGPDEGGCLGGLLDPQRLQRLSFTGSHASAGPSSRLSPQPVIVRQLGSSLTHLTLKQVDVQVLGSRLAGPALQFLHADSSSSESQLADSSFKFLLAHAPHLHTLELPSQLLYGVPLVTALLQHPCLAHVRVKELDLGSLRHGRRIPAGSGVLRSLKYETLELSNLECLPGHALDALEAVEPEGSVAGEGAAVILHLGAGSTVSHLRPLVAAVGPRLAKIIPPFATLRSHVYHQPGFGSLAELFMCLKPLGGVKHVHISFPPGFACPGSDELAAVEEVFGPEVRINARRAVYLAAEEEEEPSSEVISSGSDWTTASSHSGSGAEDPEFGLVGHHLVNNLQIGN